MAYVLAQTRFDRLLDNRPATGGGVLGVLACALWAALLVQGGSHSPSDGPEALPFMPGLVLAMGAPDAAAVTTPGPSEPSAAEPSADPDEATEPPDDEREDEPDEDPPPAAGHRGHDEQLLREAEAHVQLVDGRHAL